MAAAFAYRGAERFIDAISWVFGGFTISSYKYIYVYICIYGLIETLCYLLIVFSYSIISCYQLSSVDLKHLVASGIQQLAPPFTFLIAIY